MLLFVGIFAITKIAGRFWCGWTCPQTIFRVVYRDLIQTKLLKLSKINNKQKKIKNKDSKKEIGILIWVVLSILCASNFTWYFVPPEDFFSYLSNPNEHIFMIGFVLSIAAFLVYDVVWLQEDFCEYVCPYSRIQSVLYDNDTLQSIYNPKRGGNIYNDKKEKSIFDIKDLSQGDECLTCESCVKVCPTHIDIRKGFQLECINCLECVDACTQVMGKLGKESLIQWTSTNDVFNNAKSKLFRKSTFIFLFALGIILGLIIYMGSSKEFMLLNINRTTELYHVKKGNVVENAYILTFKNTHNKTHTYDIKLLTDNNIEIKRFKPFALEENSNMKKILILSTKDILVNNENKDTSLKLKLFAFAKDDPKVFIQKDIIFVYPRLDQLKK